MTDWYFVLTKVKLYNCSCINLAASSKRFKNAHSSLQVRVDQHYCHFSLSWKRVMNWWHKKSISKPFSCSRMSLNWQQNANLNEEFIHPFCLHCKFASNIFGICKISLYFLIQCITIPIIRSTSIGAVLRVYFCITVGQF
jgi:hypothetical protein